MPQPHEDKMNIDINSMLSPYTYDELPEKCKPLFTEFYAAL